VLVTLAVLAAAAGLLAWYCLRRRGRYQRSPKVYPEEAWLYDPPMPRSGVPRVSSEAGVPLITLSSEGGHEYAAHPLPSAAAGGGSAPGSSGAASAMSGAMSGAMAARAATPDRGDGGQAFGDRMADSAGEREGLLDGAAGPGSGGGGGGPNPYARGAYGADPTLPAMPRPPAPAVAVALPFVASARGAYARAPTADDAEADALEPYRDVHPAMREDAAVAAAAAAGVDPFRDVHPALREQPTAYDPGRVAMSADDKEIAPGGPAWMQ
jgi:hypothetical protein